MITDDQTNFLYLADSLSKKHPKFYQQFEKVLNACGISYDLLSGTKDIWCRDYMPIQIAANKFVQFKYDPDYLQDEYGQKTISDTEAICNSLHINPEMSAINVDGGNVVRASDKVIMCDKVFSENSHIPEKQLIKALQELLGVEQIVFIPTDKSDKIGHADGMVRFLDDKTVLINNYSQEKPHFQRSFRMALHNTGLDWAEIPYNPYNNKKLIQANGIYINYLQMKDVIVLPIFGMKEDEMVVEQFEQLFPSSKIATVGSNDIADHGGVLNCVTWNIKQVGNNS